MRKFLKLSSFGLVLLLVGCATSRLQKPAADFAKEVSTGSSAIAAYYQGLNSFERQLYLMEVAYDPELRVGLTGADGKPTPLVNVFTPEAIKARLDCLDLIGKHAELILALADTKAPEEFQKSSLELGASLEGLGGRFKSLAGTSSGGVNDAAAYIGPVSTLVGLFGRTALELKRDAALKRAIKDGDPAVRKILALLEKDLDMIAPLQSTGQSQAKMTLIAYYNENREKMSLEQRKKALQEIASAADKSLLTALTPPSKVIQAIGEAHGKLVVYATDPSPKNLENFFSDMDQLQSRVTEFYQASQKIAKLQQ